MTKIIHAPDGITFDINVYATAPASGLDACIKLDGMRAMAPFGADGVHNVDALLTHFPPVDGGWRLMTREEISEYLKPDEEGGDEVEY